MSVGGSTRLRMVANAVNLSTLLGLVVAAAGRAHVTRGPCGLLIAERYRLPVPPAAAFTVGDVVLTRRPAAWLLARPRLLAHEARHATQYAWCAGPVLVALYLLAAAWSWLRTGDPASRNVFERRAGLADGGYTERPVRGPAWLKRRSARRDARATR